MSVVNTSRPVPVGGEPVQPVDKHPTITSETILKASVKDRQALHEMHDLLDTLFTRNRNQHRRNHWFKSLQQFRKQLGLLIKELESPVKRSITIEKLTLRLQTWDEKYIHQWYLRFTQLVAVGPFAVLGLVLMACTARVCRITGITDLYEEIASDDMKMVMEMIDERAVEEEIGALLTGEEDVGVVIERWE